jgi:hypothetical protein
MKSLISFEVPGFQMQFRTQLIYFKYLIVFSIEAVTIVWLFTTEIRKILLRRRISVKKKIIVKIMLNLVW